MTIQARRAPGWHGRFTDRVQAGELLRPLLRRACPGTPVVVGIGVGGLVVAAHARGPGSPLGALGVEEFDLPDALHPGASSGAVSSTGRVLLRASAFERLVADPRYVGRNARAARAAVEATLLPSWYGGPVVAGRQVVLVDDGASAISRLAAAVDFVRRGRPSSVAVAVACAPRERIEEIEAFAGDAVVAVVVPWAEWFRWHGRLYESDAVPAHAEIGRLLRT